MEQKIWNYLKSKGLNDYGIAGLMGNLYAESGLKPTNLQNTYERKLGMTDAQYTAAVDNGKYTTFIRDSAGYGLAQWTYWSRKQALYNFAKTQKKSIGDLTMQLDFLIKELSESYKKVYGVLKTCNSVLQASNSVLLDYERPANQGISTQATRARFGQVYFDKYANPQKESVKMFLNPYKEQNSHNIRVTSIYGMRGGAMHKGLDLVSDGDKTLVAIGDGVIGMSTIITNKTNLTWQWGNYIRLDLDTGERVYYCHLSRRIVKAGQRVKKGDIIGVEGTTGYSTGSHLHLEIRPKGISSSAINAADFIGVKNAVGKITAVGQATTSAAKPSQKIDKGDKVKVINTLKSGNRTIGKLYNRGTFTVYYDSYDVLDAKNDRVVIGRGKQVTAAVNVENLMKI